MKLKLIVLCTLLAAFNSAYAQMNAKCDYYTNFLLVADEVLEQGKQYADNKTASGILCFENKRITLSNGYANGTTYTYNPNNTLAEEVMYIMGKKEGVRTKYFENGTIQLTQSYKNNLPEGLTREYYNDGKLKSEVYYKNGVKDGIEKIYFTNGKLDQEVSYIAGKMNGTTKIYSENGDLWGTVIYQEDKPVSGQCADGRQWTAAEINNWNNGLTIDCFK